MSDYHDRVRAALGDQEAYFKEEPDARRNSDVLPDEVLSDIVCAAFVDRDGEELSVWDVSDVVRAMVRIAGWRIRWGLPGSEERRLLVLAATIIFVDAVTGDAITEDCADVLVETYVLPRMRAEDGCGTIPGTLPRYVIDSMPGWVRCPDVRCVVPDDEDVLVFVSGACSDLGKAIGCIFVDFDT